MTRLIGSLCFTALLAQAQTFDVASVKAAEPMTNGMMRIVVGGGPGTPDPGRLNYQNVSLKMIVTNAFNVKEYQVSGPAFLDSERFDVTAKIPQGATKEQMQVMLQNLLKERFRLEFHREKKEMNSYVLLVGKNGSKMKVAEPEAPADPNAPAPPPPGGRGPMTMGKDGFPEMPKGMGGRGGGPMLMMMPGKAKMTCVRCTMDRLTDTLGNQLGKPVVDETGLKESYEFTLFFEPDMGGMTGPKGMMMAMPGPPPGPAPPEKANEETAPSLLSAIQDQLGLRLEAKKAPVDLIVIDHIEKAASEN